jgi:uncharacterized membrane protein
MNDKIKIITTVSLLIMITLVQSCTYNKEELLYPGSTLPPSCDSIPSFQSSIKNIIINKCAISGCHDAFASGGYIFQNYAQISGAKDNIKAAAVVQKIMPLSGTLEPSEINQLRCWIENGAPNN